MVLFKLPFLGNYQISEQFYGTCNLTFYETDKPIQQQCDFNEVFVLTEKECLFRYVGESMLTSVGTSSAWI